MLGEQNIISLSPELGIKNDQSNSFFLDQNILLNVLEQNEKWIDFTFKYFRLPDFVLPTEPRLPRLN